jgi:putative spermidine/putrescine transport system ATP-binding protein
MDEVLGREHKKPIAQMSDGRLSLENVSRIFEGHAAVSDVSFSVGPGELLALVGASGSGKTTTLRIAAGYETPDTGRVTLDGSDITALPPQKRGFGMVFQHYALFPHMPVEENVAFGLEARGISKPERLERARKTLDSVGLGGAGSRPIQSLSGGEQQRVALARALVIEPKVLLLDEPLSNLDPTLRVTTRDELRSVLHRVGVPALFVTHDQEDAFAIADRIAVLKKGKLLQVGTPQDLYDHPASADVAGFIGHATVVKVERKGDIATLRIGGESNSFAIDLPSNAKPEDRLAAVLRPECLDIVARDTPLSWNGIVTGKRFAGAIAAYLVKVSDGTIFEVHSANRAIRENDPVGITIRAKRIPVVPI